jgi:hypothetical protein
LNHFDGKKIPMTAGEIRGFATPSVGAQFRRSRQRLVAAVGRALL